ncbi:MAG TPA: M20/M25/M40 family metallo-hydrolase [Gemmatimonadaceae bacterium]|nr:M20/M25/M40 family metallo-hydrolase [Gemmatimonadaceae bacterium]
MNCATGMRSLLLVVSVASALHAQAVAPASASSAAQRAEERAILSELVSINSSTGTAGVQRIGVAIARRLRAAGFAAGDVQQLGPTPNLQALVVRYRGKASARKPLLLMAHMDVVPALASDWSRPPFTFGEADGWYYGRGVEDNKAGLAAIVATFVRWKRAGWVPDRDLVAVLTADEETDGNSIRWLLTNRRALFDAEFALNTDAGGVAMENGRALGVSLQASEKVYADFTLETLNPGGHSSVPRTDNAIYELSAGLSRLGAHQFPVRLTEVSTAFFRESAATQAPPVTALMRSVASGQLDSTTVSQLSAVNAYFNSVLRTTCVATRLAGGHADNALPQRATALVNCRMLPDDAVDGVMAELQRVVGPKVKVSRTREVVPSPPSPLRTDVVGTMTALSRSFFPGAPVVPEMSTGATDGLFTRNAGVPTYGVSALAFEQNEPSRAHGRDERIGVTAYHTSVAFWQQLVERLAGAPAAVP